MEILDAEESDDEKSEEGDQQDSKIDGGVIVVLLIALPIVVLPFFTGKAALLIGVSFSTAMNVLAIAQCWNLSRRIWFWIVIALILALNASLAIYANWPQVTVTRLTLLPIGAAYYCLTIGAVRFFDRFIFNSRQVK